MAENETSGAVGFGIVSQATREHEAREIERTTRFCGDVSDLCWIEQVIVDTENMIEART